MLSEHAKDLINRAIDEELSESERVEYEALVADSDEARAYSDATEQLDRILASIPPLDPPESMQRKLLSQIQLPRPRLWFSFGASWMQGKPIRYGAAAAAGLLAAVAFYELSPVARPPQDLSSMVGTLARGNGLSGVVELSYIDINLPVVQGKVTLRGSGDLRLLRFDVDSSTPVEFEVGLSGSGLSFGGFAQEAQGGTDNLLLSAGKFSVSNSGPQQFTVILRDTTAESGAKGGIVVSVNEAGESLYHGVLSL